MQTRKRRHKLSKHTWAELDALIHLPKPKKAPFVAKKLGVSPRTLGNFLGNFPDPRDNNIPFSYTAFKEMPYKSLENLIGAEAYQQCMIPPPITDLTTLSLSDLVGYVRKSKNMAQMCKLLRGIEPNIVRDHLKQYKTSFEMLALSNDLPIAKIAEQWRDIFDIPFNQLHLVGDSLTLKEKKHSHHQYSDKKIRLHSNNDNDPKLTYAPSESDSDSEYEISSVSKVDVLSEVDSAYDYDMYLKNDPPLLPLNSGLEFIQPQNKDSSDSCMNTANFVSCDDLYVQDDPIFEMDVDVMEFYSGSDDQVKDDLPITPIFLSKTPSLSSVWCGFYQTSSYSSSKPSSSVSEREVITQISDEDIDPDDYLNLSDGYCSP